jgi:hypothetical protein
VASTDDVKCRSWNEALPTPPPPPEPALPVFSTPQLYELISMTVELLAGLDGTRKLGRVVEDVARGKQVDRGVLEADAIGLVRGMLGAGFLARR